MLSKLFEGCKNSRIFWDSIQSHIGINYHKDSEDAPNANKGNGDATYISKGLRDQLQNELRATAVGVKKRYGFGWSWA